MFTSEELRIIAIFLNRVTINGNEAVTMANLLQKVGNLIATKEVTEKRSQKIEEKSNETDKKDK